MKNMKILVISPSWIGDTMISHSLYRILVMKYHPHLTIDVISSAWCAPIINRLTEVNKIFISPYQHGVLALKKCYTLGKLLQHTKYHQAIVLPNSLKSSIIPWLAKIPIRTGWLGEMRYGLLNDIRVLNKSSLPLMVQRYAALAYNYGVIQHFSHLPDPFPFPCLHINPSEIKKVLHKFGLDKNTKPIIGLCPGSASGKIKCWPHYHYITLAMQLLTFEYQIVILGSYKEQHIMKFFESNTLFNNFQKNYHNLIGKTSLNEAIVILSACKGVVSNDSGLMHIACAINKPAVISLYGNFSNPNYTPPLFSNSEIIFHNENTMDTKQNHKITKQKSQKQQYHSSLINITPNQVLKTLQKLLY